MENIKMKRVCLWESRDIYMNGCNYFCFKLFYKVYILFIYFSVSIYEEL